MLTSLRACHKMWWSNLRKVSTFNATNNPHMPPLCAKRCLFSIVGMVHHVFGEAPLGRLGLGPSRLKITSRSLPHSSHSSSLSISLTREKKTLTFLGPHISSKICAIFYTAVTILCLLLYLKLPSSSLVHWNVSLKKTQIAEKALISHSAF